MKMAEVKQIARTINKAKTKQCKARRVHKWNLKLKETLGWK
jgi:hypothetical protein